MNYLSQLREANPDLQGFSDDQVIEALPHLLPDRFGNKPMSQVRAEALLTPRELELRRYDQQGGGAGSSFERGLLRVNQSFNAAGAALGDAVMGAMPESWQQSDMGQWLQGQADQDKQDIVRDQQRLNELPQRPEMQRAVDAANQAETGMGAVGAFAKEVWDSPDTAGFVVDTLAEQVPVLASMAVGTKGAGRLFGTATAGGRAATFGTGAAIGSGTTTFGSNVAQAMGQDISQFDEATDYAFKRSLAQSIVDGTVGAVVPFKIGGSQVVNIPTQALLQAAGGASGEYAGATAVGEEASKGELVAEGLLELLSLPADVAMANIEYFNQRGKPVEDANTRIDAAGQAAAEQGGDALSQESAKAQAASSEIPSAVADEQAIADTLKTVGEVNATDLGVQFPDQQDWSQYDQAPGQRGERESPRDMSGLEGLIITADRMGFLDEAALLRTSQRLYQQAEQARVADDGDRYFSLVDRANRLYAEATETNDQVRELASQFPVPYVATGEVSGGEIGPYRGGPGRTGETYDQPRNVGGPASLEQQQTNRLADSGIIFGEEPAEARAARTQREANREQRQADDFSARYGQEGQTPYRGDVIEGELDRSNELPPAQRQAQLPPGTGQIDMGRSRPERTFTPAPSEYDGVGRNIVERTAQAQPGRLPPGNATRSITPQQYQQLMAQARSAARTPVSRRTPEMQQALEQRQAVRSGEIEVSEQAQPAAIESLESMSDADVDAVIQQVEGNMTTFDQVDWGGMPKGQGKRVGGMVTGGMSDMTALQGVKSYGDILGRIKKSEPDNYDDAVTTLSGNGDRPYQAMYAKLRLAGYGHDESLTYVVRRSEGMTSEAVSSEQASQSTEQIEPTQDIAATRAQNAKKRMFREIDPVNDDLLDAIALLDGLNRAEAEAQGIDPDVFGRQAAGIRWVFPAKGGDSFDGMAERIAQYGYLDANANRLDDFSAKLDAAINGGRKIMTPQGYEALAEKRAEAEAQLQQEHESLVGETSDEAWVAEAVVMTQDAGVPDAVTAAIIDQYKDDPVIALVELNDAINEAREASAAEAGNGNESGQGNQAEAIPASEPLTEEAAADIWGSVDPDPEPLLTSYTEADLQAQADAQAAADQAEAQSQREAEQRAQADAERDDFVLSGSDRPSDVAASRGQNDMFGAGGAGGAPESANPAQASTNITWTKDPNRKKVWRSDDGQIITDESFTAGGVKTNFFAVYASNSDRQAGNNYVSGESLADAKAKATPQPKNDQLDSIPEAVVEDTGEKLGGARKDELRTARERLDSMEDEQIASSTMAKLWPKGEIDKIEDPVSAAIYHVARDMVPNKPRVGYKVKRWVEQVKQARDLLKMVDEVGSDRFVQAIRDKRITALQAFTDKVELLTSIDRSQWDRIGRVEKASGSYRDGDEMVSGSWINVEVDGRTTPYRGVSEVSEVADQVQQQLDAVEKEKPQMKFEIRRDRRSGVYQINKAGDKEQRPLKTFDTLKESRDYLRNNNADLVTAWEAVKQRDNVTKADMRSDKNQARTGQDYRDGKDVTPNEFLEAFGLRGVEFGNWVKQGKAGKERQGLLNDAYDAFMDLAKVLNLPPRAIGLEGKLGIGFGSRGRGGRASAHFEPDRVVINLTKTKGAGSLAHEWFHALDNYFSRKRGETEFNGSQKEYREGAFVTYRPEPMMAYKPSMKAGRNPYLITKAEYNRRKARGMGFNEAEWTKDPNHPQGIRPEVEKAFAELVATLNASPMLTRSQVIDKGKVDGYWSQIIERAARSFETHIITKLAEQGYRNDFLANVTSFEKFKRDPGRYPYLTPDEQGPVSDAFDKLFSTVETKDTDSGVALFSRGNTNNPDPLTTGDVVSIVTRITADWANAPNTTVVTSESDLPADLKEAIKEGGASGQVEGVFHKGQVYLIADMMPTTADVERVLFHEALGHYGLKQLYGPAFNLQMQQLWRQLGGLDGINRLAKKYNINLAPDWENAQSWSTEERNKMMVDELVAYIGQMGEVKPDLVQRIAHMIRKGLRKLFDNTRFAERLNQMTDVEVLQVVAAARQAVTSGEARVTTITHNPQYVRQFNEAMYGSTSVTDVEDVRFSRVPDNAPVIETDGDSIAKGKTVKEMALRAREYARKHFAGKTVRNEDHGDDITISMRGIKHTIQRAKEPLLKTVAVTPEILERGVYLGREADKSGDSRIAGVHFYGAKVRVDGDLHDVVAVVKERTDGHWYYDHSIERKTGSDAHLISTRGASEPGAGEATDAGSNSAVAPPTEVDNNTSTDSVEDDQDVRFSRKPEPFNKPDETHLKVALRKIADKFQVLKDLQKNIKDAGGTVNEGNDAYLAEELFHGKTEEDLRKMRETFVKPLAEKMAKFGIEQKDLDQYLYAKHAPERNAHIAEINPELQEAGSGMSDAKAAEVVRKVKASGKEAQYEQLAKLVYDMLATRRETMRGAGLEEGGMIDAWENSYEYYVPLKGWAADEEQDAMARSGKGFNIAGKESKRALGRSSEAASPSSFAIQDLTETLIRSRKNQVGNALLKLAEDNPNDSYWQVFTNDNPDIDRQVFRSETEESKKARAAAKKAGQPQPERQYQETVRETPIPMAMMPDKYFQTKRDGQTYFIKLEDERLMKAMKNIGPDTSNFLIQTLGSINRVLSSLNTSYNPEFVVGNFARDVQTAILNLSAEQSRDDGKAKGEKIAKQTVKDIPKAMRAVYRGLRNKDEAQGGEWQKWFTEFREAGAKTGWFDMKDLDGQAADLESLISMAKGGVKGKAMKWFKASTQMVEDLNGSVENAVRLSAYVNARKAGLSKAKAASLAKNLTVNFNRRGEVGTTLNAFYMFANASIQGSMNFARTMIGLKGEKGDPVWKRLNNAQKIAAGLVMGSFAIAMMNRAAAGEDDDGENWYDKVPDYVKERNLVIMKSLLGGDADGSYWTIPLPYGYNIFHVFGNSAEAVTNGNTSAGKAATDLALAALGSFSPIGFQDSESLSGLVMRNITPTLGKPVADIIANENFMASSIYNENFPFGTPKPDSQLGRRSTPEGYKAIAEFLNDVSGGSQWRSGHIDINPDVMRYLANYFTGAAGKFVFDKAPNNVYHLATLTPIESREALFWSRISGRVLPYADRDRFYDRRDEIGQMEAEWKGLAGRDKFDFYRENRGALALRPLIKRTEKQLKFLRTRRDRIYALDLPAREQDRRLEAVETDMKQVIDRFNREYTQATAD